jgi:hypothetical protein
MRQGMLAAMVGALSAAGVGGAWAQPAKVIILRHGEKATSTALCSVGISRSLALVQEYLGKGAAKSLFKTGETPAAFLSITLHSLELASPAAASWGLPVTTYSVVPLPGADETTELNVRTQQAANDVLTNPAWNGKIVVMVWEHKHIANKALAASGKFTLRQLLNLDALTGDNKVHETWHGSNYDYFWIVQYAGSTIPTSFKHERQEFSGTYKSVPSNHWGKPEKLPANSGCKS